MPSQEDWEQEEYDIDEDKVVNDKLEPVMTNRLINCIMFGTYQIWGSFMASMQAKKKKQGIINRHRTYQE